MSANCHALLSVPASWLLLSAFAVGALSCEEPTSPPPPDTVPPAVHIAFPESHGTIYDEDGDSLADIRVSWVDARAIDPSSARLRVLQGVNGPADTAANLLPYWHVTRQDSTGLVVHETMQNLMHGGWNEVAVSVADREGNVRADTVGFWVPPMSWLKTIRTGLTRSTWHIIGATVCPDDHRMYAAAGETIIVVDADSLNLITVVHSLPLGGDLNNVLCLPGDPILYATTPAVNRFNRQALAFLPEVQGSFLTVGIVQSELDPNLLYVGESGGSLAIIDRAGNRRIREIFPFTPGGEEQEISLAVLPGDTKLYATRYVQSGVLVIDPRTGQQLHRINVGGARWPDFGRSDDIELSADASRLYVSVTDGDPRGLREVDTRTDSITRTADFSTEVPGLFAISPSGRRIFLTTRDKYTGVPTTHELMDVPTFGVLRSFPRPRAPGETRYDGKPAFRPDGKIMFIGHNLDIDVYLNRE